MLKPTANGVVSLPDTTAIEKALLAIPGVRGARILTDDAASIGEIHVISSPRRSPKKIVRDIESLLMVQYGYRVDYRRISLVQLNDDPSTTRLSLARVEEIQQSGDTFIEVELHKGEQRYLGYCVLEDDVALAAGKATVAALNSLFAPEAPLTLCGAQCTELSGREVITVYVTYQRAAVEHVLGTTFIRNGVAEAAARAVLSATNRRLAGWLPNRQHALVAELAPA